MGGGLSGKMMASRMPARPPNARPAISSADWPRPSRCSQSLSVMKAIAAFWPWPDEAEAEHAHHCSRTSGVLEHVGLDLLHHIAGALLRRHPAAVAR